MLRKITIFPIVCITENNDIIMLERVFIERMDSICQDLEIEYDKDLLKNKVNNTITLIFLYVLFFLDVLINVLLGQEMSYRIYIFMFCLFFLLWMDKIFKRSYKSWVEGQITDFPFCHPFLLWIINNNILIIPLIIMSMICFLSWIVSLTALPTIVRLFFIFMTREKDSKKKESLNEIFIKDYILCDISDFKDYLLNNKKEDLNRWVENLSYSAKGILNIKEKGMDNDNVIKGYLDYLLSETEKFKHLEEVSETKDHIQLKEIGLENTVVINTNIPIKKAEDILKIGNIMSKIENCIEDQEKGNNKDIINKGDENIFIIKRIIDGEENMVIINTKDDPIEIEEGGWNKKNFIEGLKAENNIFTTDTAGNFIIINSKSLNDADMKKVKITIINEDNFFKSSNRKWYTQNIKFLEDYINKSIKKKIIILLYFILWSLGLCICYHLYGIEKLMTTIMKIEASFNDNNLNKQELAETIKTTLCNF